MPNHAKLLAPNPKIIQALESLLTAARQGSIRALFVVALTEDEDHRELALGDFSVFEAVGAIDILKDDVKALSAAVEYDDGMFLSVAAGAAKDKQ